jgi:hypothetical protein
VNALHLSYKANQPILQRNIEQTPISFAGGASVLRILAEELQTLSGLRHDRLENVTSSVSPIVRTRVDVVTGAFVVVVVVVVVFVVVKLLSLCVLLCIWVVGPC